MHPNEDKTKRQDPSDQSAHESHQDAQRPDHRRFWYSTGSDTQRTNADTSNPKRPIDPNEVRR